MLAYYIYFKDDFKSELIEKTIFLFFVKNWGEKIVWIA
tara:strand:- start:2147 stop:2260 length:114 start_codon:yes stop_codon:yes gene_type:complete